MAENLSSKNLPLIRWALIALGPASFFAFLIFIAVYIFDRVELNAHNVSMLIEATFKTPFFWEFALFISIPGAANLLCGLSLGRPSGLTRVIARAAIAADVIYALVFIMFLLYLLHPSADGEAVVHDLGYTAVVLFFAMEVFTVIGGIASVLGSLALAKQPLASGAGQPAARV